MILALTDLVSGESQHLIVTSHGERDKGAISGLYYKDTNPIFKGYALMTLSPPKGPNLNTITLGV